MPYYDDGFRFYENPGVRADGVTAPNEAGSAFSFNTGDLGAVLGVGLGLVGSALQAKGEIAQGNAIAAAANYNAAIALMEGRYEAGRIRRAARQRLSSDYTQMAAKSGVIAESGGWLEVLVANAAAYEVDALNTEIAARNTAALERHRAKVAQKTAKQRAGAQLLSGTASAIGQVARLYA